MAKASMVPRLDAEVISIGTELLIGGRSDSNSLFLADELGKLGIAVRFKSVVGDERQDRRTRPHRGRLHERSGGLRDRTPARSSQGRVGGYEGPTRAMGPHTKHSAIAPGHDSVRCHRAEKSGWLCAGALPDMEEGAGHLLAWCAAGNGRNDAAGSLAIAARSKRIFRPASTNADRSSGVSYVRPGGGGRRCQAKRAHSERSAGRLGNARIAHGRAGLADDEGEPICPGEES